jgi:hypothetical protein
MDAGSTVNPWRDLPHSAPFVLPQDEPQIARFNQRAKHDHRFHLDIVPEPYLGNPTAPVVLLNLNPGFSENDVAIHLKPAFHAAARANLLHSYMPYPCYLLDPHLRSPGRDWWLRKLRALIDRVGLEAVAALVFIAEVHGYHSRRYRHQSPPFPSQRYTQDLVRAALGRNALVLIMRGARIWETYLPELADYTSLGRLRNVQNATISPGNCPEFFERIVSVVRRGGLTALTS